MESHASANSSDLSGSRIPELDGIRGIAILLVVVWHYVVVVSIPLQSPILRLLGTTWSGVDLFFVLSGLLIGGILLDHRNATNYYQVFYIRRIHRIVPIYYVWLTLFMIFEPILIRDPILQPLVTPSQPVWSYFTFTQNFIMAFLGWGPQWLAVTWSLAVEEQFYLTLPLLIRVIPQKRLPLALCLLISLAFTIRWISAATFGESLGIYVMMPARVDALLWGVLGAYLIWRPRWVRFLQERTTQ